MNTMIRRTAAITAGLMAALIGPYGNALEAEAPADLLLQDWYVTEIIVVQRPPVMDFSSTERLLKHRPAALPLAMRTFASDPAKVGDDLALDLLTRLNLVTPTLELLPSEEQIAAAARESEAIDAPAIEPRLEPDPLLDLLAMAGAFEEQLNARSYRLVPAEELTMSASADRLAQRSGFQVLYHGGWLQPVPPRDAPEYLLLQAGASVAGRHQLEGVLAVTLGRYLHFQAQLSYIEPGMGLEPIGLVLNPDGTGVPARSQEETHPVMTMSQSRRMRSEEIHYLDHPKLGIIVRIDPVPIPEELVAAFDALEESAE
ncbi:MAG: hypothetical protein GWM88_16705 [Pseudomonadales bacterium]|nr:hypothetical protein [Pseudomonadales bacterium]NIX09573.1 hypothetical protein [Pseudomonadales bacterium]